jgi:hypothetical protein
VYALLEPFDQTLAEVLRDRTLAPEEAREVTETLLSTLEAVEGAGLYHGHVDASGVLGVGDKIKLRSDCLTARHGDSDAPALAALVYNALTGRRFSSERDALQLPAPFATLVRAGAGSNGSLAAMRRALSGPAVNNPGTPAATPSAAGAVAAATASVSPAVSRANATPRPAPRPSASKDELDSRPRKRSVTVAAIVIMAIVLVVFWYAFKRPTHPAPISGEATPASQPQAAPATTAAAPPAATPTGDAANATGAPRTVKPAPRPSPATSAADATPANGEPRSVWHVVAYTYLRESAAQRMAAQLATKYPQLEPQVFTPTGHAPYLVTLGGGTDRQQAFERREAARAAGMPSDTYTQNFRK